MQTYNETMQLLMNRGSVRLFQEKPVPEDILREVLTAGIQSASAGNLQPFSIIKIASEENKAFLTKDCEMQSFVGKAPMNLLFCIDFNRLEQWALVNQAPFAANHSLKHFWVIFQDVIICAQTICTALDSYGLGSCYVGTTMYHNDKLIAHFQLPKKVFPVVLLSLGYPAQEIVPNKKLRVEDIVHEEFYHPYTDAAIQEMYGLKYANHDIPANERTKNQIVEIARTVNGAAYAAQVAAEIDRTGSINYAQYRFGLHYKADWMLEGIEQFKKELMDQEIDWVK